MPFWINQNIFFPIENKEILKKSYNLKEKESKNMKALRHLENPKKKRKNTSNQKYAKTILKAIIIFELKNF